MSEYFVDEDPSYLTMHRIMTDEKLKYEKEHIWGKGFTGFAEIAIKDAYDAGFMAGFYARFFKQND